MSTRNGTRRTDQRPDQLSRRVDFIRDGVLYENLGLGKAGMEVLAGGEALTAHSHLKRALVLSLGTLEIRDK